MSHPPITTHPNLDLSQKRILLVDDNFTNRLIIKKYLSRNHKSIPDEAENGREAIDLMISNEYDFVFMDIMMPEMDGYEATKFVRQGLTGNANQNVPIIAVTANTREEDKIAAFSVGMSDHLSKPIYQEDVARAINRWIDKRHDPKKHPNS